MKYVLLLLIVLLAGCNEPPPPAPEERGDRINYWTNGGGDGVPHRYSMMRDGTEILTIGHHTHGQHHLLVRYPGEEKFTIYYGDEAITAAEQSGITIEAIE